MIFWIFFPGSNAILFFQRDHSLGVGVDLKKKFRKWEPSEHRNTRVYRPSALPSDLSQRQDDVLVIKGTKKVEFNDAIRVRSL